jgi:hypothetical protein
LDDGNALSSCPAYDEYLGCDVGSHDFCIKSQFNQSDTNRGNSVSQHVRDPTYLIIGRNEQD